MQKPKTLIRRYPQTPRPGRTIGLELNDKEGINQALTVGYYLIAHGDKLGLLLRKCFYRYIQKAYQVLEGCLELRSDVWNSMLGHRISVGTFQNVYWFRIRENVSMEI